MRACGLQDLVTNFHERVRGWGDVWGTRDLDKRITIELSTRLRVSLGRALPQVKVIRINAALVDCPRNILDEVMCHEAAHIAVAELYPGYRRPHGPEWRELMRLAGFEPRVRMELDSAPESARVKHLYEHRCPVCQARRTALRAVRRWRCASCVDAGLSGELIITKLPLRGAA